MTTTAHGGYHPHVRSFAVVLILSRFRLLEPFDWRSAAAAVAVGLLVRFGLIGAVDQVLYSADVADHISVRLNGLSG